MTWRVSLRPVRYMAIFSSIPQKRTKSLHRTIAWYYIPIVFSITTKYNFIPFLFGHETEKCCKILYVVRDILSRNRPCVHSKSQILQSVSDVCIYVAFPSLIAHVLFPFRCSLCFHFWRMRSQPTSTRMMLSKKQSRWTNKTTDTVETRYNEILGTEKFCLLYQIFCYISSQ